MIKRQKNLKSGGMSWHENDIKEIRQNFKLTKNNYEVVKLIAIFGIVLTFTIITIFTAMNKPEIDYLTELDEALDNSIQASKYGYCSNEKVEAMRMHLILVREANAHLVSDRSREMIEAHKDYLEREVQSCGF
jgi:hypothetical protein